jgi:hypothetical protein
MRTLVLFAVLAVNTALSFLFAHAVIPSLVATGDLPSGLRGLRRLLYPVSAVSLAVALSAFARTLFLAVPVIQQIYPRFAI